MSAPEGSAQRQWELEAEERRRQLERTPTASHGMSDCGEPIESPEARKWRAGLRPPGPTNAAQELAERAAMAEVEGEHPLERVCAAFLTSVIGCRPHHMVMKLVAFVDQVRPPGVEGQRIHELEQAYTEEVERRRLVRAERDRWADRVRVLENRLRWIEGAARGEVKP